MSDATFFILLIALVLDWFLGEPQALWSRVPHPVVLFGKAVSLADKRLNNESDSEDRQYRQGALAMICLLLIAVLVALFLQIILEHLGWLGLGIELLLVSILLAQRSLFDHVLAVKDGLQEGGIEAGRKAVALIVGRDPSKLDTSGVSRAAIESLAENFSDGVVAPAFWYAILGLPGLIVYKMINTADSMIAYRSEKYLWFGRVAAQVDDLANWLPARLSALIIAAGVVPLHGVLKGRDALKTAFQNAGLHRSPNAGWPESAMAGGAGLALGGPRIYAHENVPQAWINATGKHMLGAGDIEHALQIFTRSCFVLWGIVLLCVLM